MQSTHQTIDLIEEDGNPRCLAREIAPGKLMVQFQDCDLARRFQVAGHEYAFAQLAENGGGLLIFFVRGKSLEWFKGWLEQHGDDQSEFDNIKVMKAEVLP